jgi:DNA-binding transcriptional ArsR family regulator
MKMHPTDMQAAAVEASELLKALASPHRLMIICQLIERERSVGELADFLKLRHSTVSQHLALLRKDGLVTPRRDGQTIWYSIASAPARELLTTLYRIYCGPQPLCEPAAARASAPKRTAAPKRAPARSRS